MASLKAFWAGPLAYTSVANYTETWDTKHLTIGYEWCNPIIEERKIYFPRILAEEDIFGVFIKMPFAMKIVIKILIYKYKNKLSNVRIGDFIDGVRASILPTYEFIQEWNIKDLQTKL